MPEIETLHNRGTYLATGSSDWTCESRSCRTRFPLRPVDGPPRMAASSSPLPLTAVRSARDPLLAHAANEGKGLKLCRTLADTEVRVG